MSHTLSAELYMWVATRVCMLHLKLNIAPDGNIDLVEEVIL